jgi:alcohol dehydrogenase, propanol-preferring
MRAMVLRHIASLEAEPNPLTLADLPMPVPGPRDVRVRVATCGVCHTEIDEIEGRTPPSSLPRVLGHQAVGQVEAVGADVSPQWIGERVGVAWVFRTCRACRHCRAGLENLCERFEATGRDADGGYAEFLVAPVDFVHRIPGSISDVAAAPLLCAGAIGYRSLKLTELSDGRPLGLTGFGASAHLVVPLARRLFPRSPIFVFARSEGERQFALEIGAAWAGPTDAVPPEPPAAIIDTTPAWGPVVTALERLDRGGRLVINAIRKEAGDRAELERLDYPSHLWLEKEIKSVANVSRTDVREFLDLAASIPIVPEVQTYPLEQANRALGEMKAGRIRGAKVLIVTEA